MIRRQTPILFVLGASGSGKSTLGRALAERGFRHLEIDRWFEGDGIDLAGLRREWDSFLATAWIAPLVAALDARTASLGSRGIVLTFPGTVTFDAPHLVAIGRAGVHLIVLHSTVKDCLAGFVAREREHGRPGDPAHWLANNAGPHAHFDADHHAPYRLTSYRDGSFIGAQSLVDQALSRIDGASAAEDEGAALAPPAARTARHQTR
jgi:hypothetical protein